MKPDIDHVITFIKVVELGSFTAAADALKVSKSVVSKHVSSLEEALSSQLVMRSTRKLDITEIGQTFYQHVKSIPTQINQATQALQPFNDQPQGPLKVIMPSQLSSSLKADLIPDFLLSYPKINLTLAPAVSVEDQINDAFDIIIFWKLNESNFPEYNLVGKRLFQMPVALYATPEYLKAHGTPKTPEDLKQHNCFSSVGTRWPFKEKNGPLHRIDIQGNLKTKNEDIIHGAIMKHLGIAYSYPFLFREELQKKAVKKVLADYTQIYIDVYAFYHPMAYVPLKIRSFIDRVAGYYQAMQADILKRGN